MQTKIRGFYERLNTNMNASLASVTKWFQTIKFEDAELVKAYQKTCLKVSAYHHVFVTVILRSYQWQLKALAKMTDAAVSLLPDDNPLVLMPPNELLNAFDNDKYVWTNFDYSEYFRFHIERWISSVQSQFNQIGWQEDTFVLTSCADSVQYKTYRQICPRESVDSPSEMIECKTSVQMHIDTYLFKISQCALNSMMKKYAGWIST